MFNWSENTQFMEMSREPQYAEIVKLIDNMEERISLKRMRAVENNNAKTETIRPDVVITGKHFYEHEVAVLMLIYACKKMGIVSEDAVTAVLSDGDFNEKIDNHKAVVCVDLSQGTLHRNAQRRFIREIMKAAPNIEMILFYGNMAHVDSFKKNNAELCSYIPVGHWLEICGYSEQEMAKCIENTLLSQGCTLSSEAKQSLPVLVRQSIRNGCPENAIGARILVQNMLAKQADRLKGKNFSKEDPKLIIGEDMVTYGADKYNAAALDQIMQELDQMIGLAPVKQRVKELKAVAQVARERAMRNISATKPSSRHMVFTGNAGTGKTSVAKIIAEIYYQLGLLENNNVVVASRADLVAAYQGQTAIKTKKVIDSALGGVLFIDEAYSLALGVNDSYGREAIDILLAEMENNRDRLIVILAGYEKEINELLATNQGLNSRFSKSNAIHFPDYTVDELVAIYHMIVKQRGQKMRGVKDEEIRQLILDYQSRQKQFGNARGVRNLVETAERSRDFRIAGRLNELENEELSVLTRADVLGETVNMEVKQYLNVSYEERNEAKKWGAKWDKDARKWYVLLKEGEEPNEALSKWLPKN